VTDRPAIVARPGLLAALPVQAATAAGGVAAGLPALLAITAATATALATVRPTEPEEEQ
jgi:hypothetical protein